MTLDPAEIARAVDSALAEDVGRGDLTTRATVPEGTRLKLVMVPREDIVPAGLEVAAEVFKRLAPDARIEIVARDGVRAATGTALMRIEGPAHGLLTAERTALNFVQLLSGIATLTRTYVDAIGGTGAVLLDTRKTLPGLRTLSKYATRMGGAVNHRMRLDDGMLIKDNHVAAAGGIGEAVRRAVARAPQGMDVRAECDTLEQVEEALEAGATSLLLDNMAPDTLRRAVAIVNGRVPLEASGGVNLKNIRAIAETGVDYISTGRITQGATAVDIGLDLDPS